MNLHHWIPTPDQTGASVCRHCRVTRKRHRSDHTSFSRYTYHQQDGRPVSFPPECQPTVLGAIT